MKNSTFIKLALAGVLTFGTGAVASAQGDSGALIDALVRKNILTSQEGEDLRADLIKENAATSAGKISIGSSITQLRLSGDLRLRYEYSNNDAQIPPNNTRFSASPSSNEKIQTRNGAQNSRFRYRLRLGADVTLAEGWTGGFGLQTTQSSDSGNQTYDDNFANDSIFISRAWVGYQPTDWLTFRGGKFANPLYTTDLVWDSDINPEGFFQSVAIHKLFASSVEETTGYDKDGKAFVSSTTVRRDLPWELTLNAGQFILNSNISEDTNVRYQYFTTYKNSTRQQQWTKDASFLKTDAWLFTAQLVGAYKFDSKTKLTFAPGVMIYNGGSATNLNNSASLGNQTTPDRLNTSAVQVSAYRDLNIITAPGDIAFTAFGLKTKVLWDFAYNLNGAARANEVLGLSRQARISSRVTTGTGRTAVTTRYVTDYTTHSQQDDLAWLAGIQVGENRKKGDWSVYGNFRQVGVASIDPNINDSDFAFSNLNTQGFKFGVAYNITDFAVFGVTYFNYWNLRPNLGVTKGAKRLSDGRYFTTATSGVPTNGNYIADGSAAGSIANANAGEIVQVDLSVRF